jgi:hypothetical protein
MKCANCYTAVAGMLAPKEETIRQQQATIERLLAVIKVKDTALANVIVADRFCAETNVSGEHRQAKADAHHEALLSVESAIAIKPDDVELVEVGEADFDKPAGTVNLDIYNIDFDGLHNLYTIKQKG